MDKSSQPAETRRFGEIETIIDRGGMGLWYGIKMNGVLVWCHAFAMDGPISEEAERIFLSILGRCAESGEGV